MWNGPNPVRWVEYTRGEKKMDSDARDVNDWFRSRKAGSGRPFE